MPKWKFKRESSFNKQYKLIGRQRQSRVEEALLDLENADNPASKGDYKINLRIWAYHIGSDRLLYTIDYQNGVIVLLRVCDHKSAYGKD